MKKLLAILALTLVLVPTVSNSALTTKTFTATATLFNQIVMTQTTQLNFGYILLPAAAGTSTITLDYANGVTQT